MHVRRQEGMSPVRLCCVYLCQQLDERIRNAKKILILLHINPAPYHTPSNTRLWIEKRQGVNQVRRHPPYTQPRSDVTFRLRFSHSAVS